MKTPLLTHELYSAFVAAGAGEGNLAKLRSLSNLFKGEILDELTRIVALLPKYNQTILKTLMLFLNKVKNHSIQSLR